MDLLVAAILSAQTRDEVVNAITPELFKKFRSVDDYAKASADELIKRISRVSFAGNKAKNIIQACRTIKEKYNGVVPNRMEQLVELPGIGRKTANTILINAYNIVVGIPVDTWVIKLSYRIGLSKNKDPEEIEQDLMKLVDKKDWNRIAYIMKVHGHRICQSMVPICSKCFLLGLCPKNGVTKSL
jgi:endonuclease-3